MRQNPKKQKLKFIHKNRCQERNNTCKQKQKNELTGKPEENEKGIVENK